jgi:hypothetical protein
MNRLDRRDVGARLIINGNLNRDGLSKGVRFQLLYVLLALASELDHRVSSN